MEVALQAKQALPACHSRIEAAIKIIIAGDVEELPDGTAKVASQSNGNTTYHIVNGHCDCPDAKRAPEGWCKHRLAAAIDKRAHTLAKQRLQERRNQSHDQEQEPAPFDKRGPSTTNPLPKHLITASFRTIVHGVEVTFTLQDSEETILLTCLDVLLAHVQIRQRYSRAWEHQIERARTLFQQR